MSKLKAHQFSEQFFKERGELMSRLAWETDLDNEELRRWYMMGIADAADDEDPYEFTGEFDLFAQAAYDLGYDAGFLPEDTEEFNKAITEKLRQIHGVQT